MQLICKAGEDTKVIGEDWDSLMWHNDKLFSGSFANGKIKVWSPDLKPVAEWTAHDYPIYHMSPGLGNTFYTSSFDLTIKHWEDKGDGSFKLLATLEGHSEPPRKLRFFNGRLFSGDDKGEVKIWEDDHCLGTLETPEEIWDLLAIDGHFITVRHIDVTIYSLTQKDDKFRSCVRHSVPGRSPLHISENRLCSVDRVENVVNVHTMDKSGYPLVGRLKGHEAIINAMTSSGSHLVSGACDNNVIAWDLDSLSQTGSLGVDGYVNALVGSPGGLVYAAGENKFIACLKVI